MRPTPVRGLGLCRSFEERPLHDQQQRRGRSHPGHHAARQPRHPRRILAADQTGGRDVPGTVFARRDDDRLRRRHCSGDRWDDGLGRSENGLMVVNADGTGRRRVGTLLDIGDRAEWSPDGRSILVASQGRLYSVDVATGSATPLAIKDQPDASLGGATWSPDGTQILFKKYGGGAVIYTMRLDGTDLVQVSPRDATGADWGTHPAGGIGRGPRPAGDSRRINPRVAPARCRRRRRGGRRTRRPG